MDETAKIITKPVAPVIPVPEDLRRAHPIVRELKRMFDQSRVGENGMVDTPYDQRPIAFCASRKQLHRGLRLLDALIQELERRGCRFEKDPKSKRMVLIVGQDPVSFSLCEELDREPDEERSANAKQIGLARWQRWKFFPSEMFVFVIHEYWPVGGRKSWKDGVRQRLEDKLGEIVDWLIRTGEAVKIERLKREEMYRRWAEEEQRRREEEARRQMEERNREELKGAAASWAQAATLRAFIRACEEQMRPLEGEADTWQGRWLTWAREQEERLDPLRNGFLDTVRKKIRGKLKTSPKRVQSQKQVKTPFLLTKRK